MSRDRLLIRNFTLLTFDGIFFFLGMIFLSLENVVPVILRSLGSSDFTISLVPVLGNLGVFFPSILIASYLQTLRRKKKFIVGVGALQRLPWLIAAVTGFLFARHHPAAVSVVLLAAVFLASAGAGLTVSAFFYLTAKVIPLKLRGRLFGVRNMGSYIIGLMGGVVMKYLLDFVPFPDNFNLILLIGFFCVIMSIIPVALVREPDALQVTPPVPLRVNLRRVLAVFRTDPDFARFIIARSLLILALTSTSYFTVYLVNKFSLSDGQIGVFTVVIACVYIVFNPLLGYLADRKGHRIVFIIGSAALVTANLAALFASVYWNGIIVVISMGVAICARLLSSFPMTIEYCDNHEIPLYIGIAGFYIALAALLIVPLGIIADALGLRALFLTCSLLALTALLLFIFLVREPRRHRKARNGTIPS